MYVQQLLGTGVGQPHTFSCSTSGVCSGSPYFKVLQQELNRVRPLYGLPADVVVDGKIGTVTLAKLIKTAQAINRALGERRDGALDDYVYPDIALNVTPKMLAQEAPAIAASLRRNGIAPEYLPPDQQVTSVMDPYADAITAGGGSPPKLPTFTPIRATYVSTTTATTPTTEVISPMTPFPAPSGGSTVFKIVGGVLGGVLLIGGAIAIGAGLSRKRRG